MPALQINNTQAPHSDCKVILYVNSIVIRTPVFNGLQHASHKDWIRRHPAFIRIYSTDSTHNPIAPFPKYAGFIRFYFSWRLPTILPCWQGWNV
jgi:hypothetical protein